MLQPLFLTEKVDFILRIILQPICQKCIMI